MKTYRNSMKVCIVLALALMVIAIFPHLAVGVCFDCPQDSLRVALGVNLPSTQFAACQGSYELIDYVTQRVITPNTGTGNWVVAPKGAVNIQLSYNGVPVEGSIGSLLVLRQKDTAQLNLFSFKGKRYRGDLLVQNLNGTIHIINIINIEQYLYGVVGAEMGTRGNLEAYKAQAVVSRTYACYYKKNPQLNYDLGITTQWQLYGGYDAEETANPLVKQAVNETKGLVIFYDNSIIQAFFHANSGGYTESPENVWDSSIPYLNPVPVPQDACVLAIAKDGGWPANTYQWEKTFTTSELGNITNAGKVTDVTAGCWAVDTATGGYKNVRTQSGRVTQLDIIGTSGTKSFFKDGIRSVLGLKSTLFEIVMDSTVGIWDALGLVEVHNNTQNMKAVNAEGQVSGLNGSNTNYYVLSAEGTKAVPKSFSKVTIKGKGYGHGLGMSQWGAIGMAAEGMNYQRIIEHFYNQNRNDGRLKIAPAI